MNLVGIVAGWLLLATMPQGELERAERAYRQGHYELAQQIYGEALAAARDHRGALLANLGNCTFQQQRFAAAAAYYRRALLRLPDDEGLRLNLALANRRLGLSATELALPRPPHPVLLAAAVVLPIAGLLLLASRRRTQSHRGVAVIALAGAVFVVAVVVREQWSAPAVAVLALDSAELRADSRTDAAVAATMRPGEVAVLRERRADWLRVDFGTTSGWLPVAGAVVID